MYVLLSAGRLIETKSHARKVAVPMDIKLILSLFSGQCVVDLDMTSKSSCFMLARARDGETACTTVMFSGCLNGFLSAQYIRNTKRTIEELHDTGF